MSYYDPNVESSDLDESVPNPNYQNSQNYQNDQNYTNFPNVESNQYPRNTFMGSVGKTEDEWAVERAAALKQIGDDVKELQFQGLEDEGVIEIPGTVADLPEDGSMVDQPGAVGTENKDNDSKDNKDNNEPGSAIVENWSDICTKMNGKAKKQIVLNILKTQVYQRTGTSYCTSSLESDKDRVMEAIEHYYDTCYGDFLPILDQPVLWLINLNDKVYDAPHLPKEKVFHSNLLLIDNMGMDKIKFHCGM